MTDSNMITTSELERDFELWWENEGQFLRSGGGQYEKTFAYHSWIASARKEQQACGEIANKKASEVFSKNANPGRPSNNSLFAISMLEDVGTRIRMRHGK